MSLTTLLLLALVAQPHASLAEGWGVPPRSEESQPHAVHADASHTEVLLTASGSVKSPSSLMRRHQEEGSEEHHHDHQHLQNVKASFALMDLDGDGVVTGAELKAAVKQRHLHHPKALDAMLDRISDKSLHTTSFEEFRHAVHKVAQYQKLHHSPKELKESKSHNHVKHQANHHHKEHTHHHHKHHGQSAAHGKVHELLEAHEETDNGKVVTSSEISCGGNDAATCAACTEHTKADGTIEDKGSEFCNGDCMWEATQPQFSPKCIPSALSAGAGTGVAHGETVADILNSTITAKDEAIIDRAAEQAIKEENLEAGEKQAKEEKAAEDGKFSWGKFWLIVIITFSVILGICAISSIVVLGVFMFTGAPGKDVGDEAEGFTEGEGEGEGEEASVEAS